MTPAHTTTTAWGLAALYAAAALVPLAQFFGANVDYLDRALIVGASGWLVWRHFKLWRDQPDRPTWLGHLPLVAAALLLPPALFLYAQVGPRPILLFWTLAAAQCAIAGVTLLQFGPKHLRGILFPLLFVLFAPPMPDRIHGPLQNLLQHGTTSAAAFVLPLLGFPTVRNGFTLTLPHGALGVAEACSGVRSLAALLAIGALVAHLRGFSFLRGAILVVLSIPVVVLCNAVRVVVSGVLQEKVGGWIVEGAYHEALGYAVLFLGLFVIVQLARQLEKGWKILVRYLPAPLYRCVQLVMVNLGPIRKPVPPKSSVPLVPRAPGWLALGLLAAGLSAGGIFWAKADVALGERAELAPLEQLPMKIDDWEGEDLPIPRQIKETLTFDRAICRHYRNRLGQDMHVYVMYWTASTAIKGFHHPDICMPNSGWTKVRSERLPLPLTQGAPLGVTVREFALNGRRQWVGYWTQEGGYVWTDQDEIDAMAAGPSHGWVLELFRSGERRKQAGRLAVLLGTELWGKSAETAALGFARKLADELYVQCPWALPDASAAGQRVTP